MEKPKNLKEAIQTINPMFDGMDKYFEATPENPVKGIALSVYDENTFASFCHSQISGGIGMKIRNYFEFWHNKETDLYKDLFKNHHCKEPDAMSDKIIRGIYQLRTFRRTGQPGNNMENNENEMQQDEQSPKVPADVQEMVNQEEMGAHYRPFENLTFEQAQQYLSEGRPVKLPEWGGFWFAIGNEGHRKIFVFTKEGEILDTPDYETYGTRNDWTTVIATGEGGWPEIMIPFVKALRRQIDAIRDIVELSKNREKSLASTALQLGFMWLGLYLGELGNANPYPKSMDPASPTIEKHADKAEGHPMQYIKELYGDDYTAQIKALRAETQTATDMILFIAQYLPTGRMPQYVAVDRLIEAKLWLGQELNNIRLRSLELEEKNDHHKKWVNQQAIEAYSRYCSVRNFQKEDGTPLPNFESLSEQKQDAWRAAANTRVPGATYGNQTGEMLSPGNKAY